MPEGAETPTAGSQTVPPASAPPGGGPGGAGGLNLGLLLAFLAILALVCIQNRWLRRRGEREPRREDEGR